MSFWEPSNTNIDDGLFNFEATSRACVGHADHQFLMGGVAMAAAIEAAERFTGKSLLWATIQFLSGGKLGDHIAIQIEQMGGGRSVAQVVVRLSAGGKILQHVSAALGGRSGFGDSQFALMPDVPAPEKCPIKKDNAFSNLNNLMSQFERRTAFECSESGIEHMWIRPTFDTEITAAMLGITSDFILGAHRQTRGGTSLDNTLRIHSTQPTEWILCSAQISGFSNGTASGVLRQFTQGGTLLSTSSQTGLMPRVPNT